MPCMPRRGVHVQLYLFLTSLLDDGWSMPRPSHFTPSKELWCPLYRRLARPQQLYGWVWRRENLVPQLGCEPQTIQAVAGHYTNYAMQAPSITIVHDSVGAGALFPGIRQPEYDVTHLSPVCAITMYGTLFPLLHVLMAQGQLFLMTDSIEYNS
jgi:hypothetical protein